MNQIIRLFFLNCVFIAIVQTSEANPLPPAPDIKTGQKIFEKHCKVCHGLTGDGATFAANALNPPPRNFTSAASKKELTAERMLASVFKGRKGTAMMPWEGVLSKQEIHSAVLYIRKKLMHLPE